MLDNISISKQSSVRVNNNIYIDPYGIEEVSKDAKYIFITHDHYDHFSKEDIDKIVNDDTIFVIPSSMKDRYDYNNDCIFVDVGKNYLLDDISFKTLPMYNLNKQYHKKEYNWCGYIIRIDGKLYYFVGDSDYIPEMNGVKCDYLFIPIGGTYTMDLTEALDAIKNINYEYVIPYHYGSIVGDINLGNEMKNILGEKCILKIK